LGDDREIWERVCRGDRGAFERLYQEHGPGLIAFLRRVTGDSEAADDVMQETFAQIWKRPDGFQPERGTLRAYLFGAARKRAAEWWRQKGREHGIAISAEYASEFKTETGSLVGDAFQRLPEEQRTLLWLREVEGQSYAELAEILGIPVGTVRSRLFAAREELRRVWNDTAKVKEELR
jgi:RNA polymerase sigma-70 factor (ECF subfamily)